MNFFPSVAKDRRAVAPARANGQVELGTTNIVVAAGALAPLRDVTVLPRSSGRDRRRAARYLCELRTACVVISLVEPVLLSARVRDISQNGIGLLLPSRVHPGSFLAVKLQGPRDLQPRIVRARVVRVVAQPDRRSWFHGCALVGELQREDLARLL